MTEQKYLSLLAETLEAPLRMNRTAVPTRSLFGRQLRFDLRAGFPFLTTRHLSFHIAVVELLWHLQGSTCTTLMLEHDVKIWEPWAKNGEVGPVYGAQWRNWGLKHDQLTQAVEKIRKDPDCRRIIVSAWNVADLDKMALPPCQCLFQFYVDRGTLSCQVYARSADVFIGLPYDLAVYGLLLHIMAWLTELRPAELIFSFGDVHLYECHQEQACEQLKRNPHIPPTVRLAPRTSLDEYVRKDFTLVGYDPWPAIKTEVVP